MISLFHPALHLLHHTYIHSSLTSNLHFTYASFPPSFCISIIFRLSCQHLFFCINEGLYIETETLKSTIIDRAILSRNPFSSKVQVHFTKSFQAVIQAQSVSSILLCQRDFVLHRTTEPLSDHNPSFNSIDAFNFKVFSLAKKSLI